MEYLNSFNYEDTGIDWTVSYNLVEEFSMTQMRYGYLIDMEVTDQDGNEVNLCKKMKKIITDEIWKDVKANADYSLDV